MDITLITILSTLIVSVIGMFLVNKFNVKFLGLNLSFQGSKNKKINNKDSIISLTLQHSKNIHEYNSQIMKNSMIFVVGMLAKISQNLKIHYDLYKVAYIISLVKTFIRETILRNGYTSFGKQEFDTYISLKTLEITEIFDKELGVIDPYVHSEDFAKIINDIYQHSFECIHYWNMKIKDEMIEFGKRIK